MLICCCMKNVLIGGLVMSRSRVGGGGRRVSSAAGRGDSGISPASAASIPILPNTTQPQVHAHFISWAWSNRSLMRGFLCSGAAVSLQ